eukprot:7204221-Pyramimonas_sp.AAC.1
MASTAFGFRMMMRVYMWWENVSAGYVRSKLQSFPAFQRLQNDLEHATESARVSIGRCSRRSN